MRAVAVTCLAVALLLSGCNARSDGEPGAASSPSPAVSSPSPGPESASPTPGQEETPAKVPPPPRGKDDRRGREEFAAYVLQAWIYALNTNDPGPLLAASGKKPCSGCAELQRELRKRERQGWHVALDGVRVAGTKIASPQRTTLARMRVAIPESETYFEDGRLRGTNPGHRRSTFEVEMRHTGKAFRLVSFSLY